MFNLDKILRRSLSKDTAMMKEKYEYCIQIDNGMDSLYVYLTKNELKKLTIKDEFGNDSLNIPDKKVHDLWSKYYANQKTYRKEKIEDVSLDDIPKIGNSEYHDFADYFTVEEWIKVVNGEAVLAESDDGRIIIEPVVVLEEYIIERLVNRTDIHDDFIYEVKFEDNDIFTPLTFKELKKYAKEMSKRLVLDDDHTDGFLKFLTKGELEKIKNKEIALYETVDKFLLVAVDD